MSWGEVQLHNVLLQELVEMIETLNRLPMQYQHPALVGSRSRGRCKVQSSFIPDEPLEYIRCNTQCSLSMDLHNKLCLLRGVLKELLPTEEFLGNSRLPGVVRVSMSCFCSFPLWGCFSLKDLVAHRGLRSPEETCAPVTVKMKLSHVTLSPGSTLEAWYTLFAHVHF